MTVVFGYQYHENPQFSIIDLFFGGVSYADVLNHRANLPVAWFIYLMAPVMILLNSIWTLWEKHTANLRGLGFTHRQFCQINVYLVCILSFFYTTVTFIIFEVISVVVVKHSISIAMYCSILLTCIALLLVQLVASLMNQTLSIVVPIFVLLATAYTKFEYNPFNLSMTLRMINKMQIMQTYVYMIISIIILILVYLLIGSRKDSY